MTDPDVVRHLGALPFPALGPAGWRSCQRAIGSHAYGPSVGFTSLGLSHWLDDQEGPPQGLAVTVTAVAPSPEATARSLRVDDGQWSATALTGDWHLSLSAQGWPRDGLELVEVDPLPYLAGG